MNWRPVITDSEIRKTLMLKLQSISEAVKGFPTGHAGLMGGESGKALFFFYLYQLTSEERYLNDGVKVVESITENMQTLFTRQGHFSSGVTGFGWLLQHLKNEAILESGADEFLSTLDIHNSDCLNEYLRYQNYDFLHGALGVGLYYLSRLQEEGNINLLPNIENIILSLNENSVWREECCYWYGFDISNNIVDYAKINLGLAHGLPSVILFLIQTMRFGILEDLTRKMIRGTIATIRKCKVDPDKYSCFFPNTIEHGVPTLPSRLAWCYGDLGIAYCLLKAGQILDDESLVSESLEIFKYQVKRTNFKANMIWDAGFCHGTAGIGFLFQKAFNLNGSLFLKEAAEFWYQATLQLSTYHDGLAGFKSYRGTAINKYECDAGLIEGLSGTALCIIALIAETPQQWAEAFLL